jgi:hypothetical protein
VDERYIDTVALVDIQTQNPAFVKMKEADTKIFT